MKLWLEQAYQSLSEHPFTSGVLPHLLTVAGVLLALFAIARLMSERKQPGNTMAWLLAIVLVPYIGVPLFLIFGGRKIRRLVAAKARLSPPATALTPCAAREQATARILTINGAVPPVGGNRVRFMPDGQESYLELERQILATRKTIHVMTFILGRDAVGQRFVQLLAQKAREGVKVRLLLDSLGCFMSSGSFCDPIRQAGGEVVKFMPVLPLQTRGSANLRNHRKIAVFDHRVAAVGGRNLAQEYMGPTQMKKRWRDFGAMVEGPAVSILENIFLADWAFASGQSLGVLSANLPPPETVVGAECDLQVVASGPDVAGDTLYEGILSLVQQATRSIWVITPYFIPDEVLYRMLLLKAREGLDVRLVVPARSNHPITDLARRHYLRGLYRAGAKVLLYTPGMNHAKVVLADESHGLWGSANMDQRSLFVNFECGVFTYSPGEARAISAWMHDVFAQSKPMPEPRTDRRLIPAIGEELSRLLAPML